MKPLILILSLFISFYSFSSEKKNLKHTFYAGAGNAENSSEFVSDNIPWSLGYLYKTENNNLFGVDISGESTLIDNTSGQNNTIRQGISFNLSVGRNINFNSESGTKIGLLIGTKQTGKSCQDSYLGFQCYADATPDIDYEVNYGGILQLFYKNVSIGARVTEDSQQMTIGILY